MRMLSSAARAVALLGGMFAFETPKIDLMPRESNKWRLNRNSRSGVYAQRQQALTPAETAKAERRRAAWMRSLANYHPGCAYRPRWADHALARARGEGAA